MKSFLLVGQIVLSIILITFGFNQISKPSDLLLTLGVLSVIGGLLLLYRPFKVLIKQF
jgi:hypothetical protein